MYDNAHHKMHLNATREVHILEVHLDIRFRLWTFAEKGMMTDRHNHRESRGENPWGTAVSGNVTTAIRARTISTNFDVQNQN